MNITLLFCILAAIVCILQVCIIFLLIKMIPKKTPCAISEDVLKCFVNQDSGKHMTYY